jgi:hypothetical protein
VKKPINNDRVTRWLLFLQEFYITIVDKSGKENFVVDFLSRITNTGEIVLVEDTFLYEHLFVLSTNTLWFTNIAKYLVVGNLPSHISPKEKIEDH